MTVKPDDVTKGRKDLDAHGRLRANGLIRKIRECLKSKPKEDLSFVLNFVQIAVSINLFSHLQFQLRLEFSHKKRNLGHGYIHLPVYDSVKTGWE